MASKQGNPTSGSILDGMNPQNRMNSVRKEYPGHQLEQVEYQVPRTNPLHKSKAAELEPPSNFSGYANFAADRNETYDMIDRQNFKPVSVNADPFDGRKQTPSRDFQFAEPSQFRRIAEHQSAAPSSYQEPRMPGYNPYSEAYTP